MKKTLSITDLDLKGKRALIRVDFNVPLDKNQQITDDTRIVASLPTIKYVLEKGGSVILMSHLGRPKGRNKELSLVPCAERLAELLGQPVQSAFDCIGPEVALLVEALEPGDVLMLENLRFHEAEEKPERDPHFAEQLAKWGDVYINDAFGTAHREHSSTAVIAKYFPNHSAAGFLLLKEIDFLGKALLEPKRPFYAIIGGSKISSKVGVIESLLAKADKLLIGGGMSYTFAKAKGYSIGNSIHEDDFLPKAKDLLSKYGDKIMLPIDNVTADHMDASAQVQIVETAKGIPDGYQGVDIGPKTIEAFISQLQDAATVLWNGPLGVFEIAPFAKGTDAIAHAVADLKAITIVGGGDSIAAIQKAGVADKITHISTGGGASLEYIEFGTLPGIEALT